MNVHLLQTEMLLHFRHGICEGQNCWSALILAFRAVIWTDVVWNLQEQISCREYVSFGLYQCLMYIEVTSCLMSSEELKTAKGSSNF